MTCTQAVRWANAGMAECPHSSHLEGRRQTNSCCRTHLSVMVASLRMALALALFQAVARAGGEFADGAPR